MSLQDHGLSAEEKQSHPVLEMARRGWRLHPCKPHDKRPIITAWQDNATADLGVVSAWLETYEGCNWGIATGAASNLLVLDIDGDDGIRSLLKFDREGNQLPETLLVSTGRGTHIYFTWPEGVNIRNSAGKIGAGLDIRGEGGYVLAPPSVHPSGAVYQFVDELQDVAPAPAWLLSAIAKPDAPAPSGTPTGKIPIGQTNDTLTRLAGSMRRKGFDTEAIEAALLIHNRTQCEGPMDEQRVKNVAKSVTRYAPDSSSFPRTSNLVNLSDVQGRDVEWLWKPYLPAGMLALLSGDPGTGKTFCALAIAAAITNGRTPFSDEQMPAGDVLYMSRENPLAETTRPRLDALGANVRRFHSIEGINVGDEVLAITLADLDVLEQAVKQVSARLLIIDPVQSFLGAGVDAHRANETRPILDGLAKLAEANRCCVLMLRHTNKASGGKAIYRGMGSIDFTGAARTEMFAAKHPSDDDLHVLAHGKSNIGPHGPSMSYRIPKDRLGFEWAGTCEIYADELMSPAFPKEETTSAVAEAEEFLRGELATGPRSASEVLTAAKTARIGESSLRKAKANLRVIAKRENHAWWWELTASKALVN